jgi:hypothetical protein
MKTSLLPSLIAAAFIGLGAGAQAAVMTVPVAPSGAFTVTDTTGPQAPEVFDFVVTPTTNPNPVVYYDTNPPTDQSASSIGALIATAYSLSTAPVVKSQCDNIPGGCSGMTANSTTFSLTGVPAFDYLALHFGGGELFFHWSQPITAMSLLALDGFPGGLSNYRSYLSTPIPGALALFLGAMGLLGARRKFAQRESAAPAIA